MRHLMDLAPLLLATLWLGFVLAISFMESWIKFRAPGVTLSAGLSIGSLVFRALNRVEWLLLLASAAWFAVFKQTGAAAPALLCAGGLLLAVQTFYLLPKLNARAQALIAGKSVTPSRIHLAFVASEIIKTVLLITFVFAFINQRS